MSSESYPGYPECVVSCHGAGRLANSIRPFFIHNGRHAGKLGDFPEYVNRMNLRAEMEQGAVGVGMFVLSNVVISRKPATPAMA